MYCKAPLVSASVWPNNEITPCCLWQGPTWNSLESMSKELTDKFLSGDIPQCCQSCSYRQVFEAYDSQQGLQFLDWRNDNLCNLKCRSCTPQWSSKIAQEQNVYPVRNFQSLDLDSIEWKNIKSVYFCGGEPFLSQQHLDILQKINQPQQTRLVYNTNCMSLYYKNHYIPDLWSPFQSVTVNASIDAVGLPIEHVRSGSNWAQIDLVLREYERMQDQGCLTLNVTPYISALNIWWIDSWVQRFDHYHNSQIQPIVGSATDIQGLAIIPFDLRPLLIEKLTNNKFANCFASAVDILRQCDLTKAWPDFLHRQAQLDIQRKESWTTLFKQASQT